MTADLSINGARLWGALMEMAQIGALPGGGCRRLALSDEDKAGRDLFVRWCREAGCAIGIDAMGNIFARRVGSDASLAPVAIGSHLDTQPHGGKFDGVFGVLAALEVVRTLNDRHIQTAAPLEIIMWTNEEGARFAPAMMASGVFAGSFGDLEWAHVCRDESGKSVGDELRRIGYAGENKPPHRLRAFLEAHIEQGPVLEKNGVTIGAVTGAQGVRWFDVAVIGRDAHSGSTPMNIRYDALAASAEMILAVEKTALEFGGVGTVGAIRALPNSRNTIAGRVEFSLDMRHPDDARLKQMSDALQAAANAAAARRKVELEINQVWHCPPTVFDSECVQAVRAAAHNAGISCQDIVSGAGHDACQIARVAPTAMVFIPCKDGVSHSEDESATPADVEAGANVLLGAALALANSPGL